MDKKVKNIKFILVYIIGAVILTLIDQYSKLMAVNDLKDKNPVELIPGVLEFSYLENKGMAWGMMSGARVFFIILTVVILCAITVMIVKMPREKKYIPLYVSLILLCAGALGNFIDRLLLGYVRDFIYFKLINFPVFNVADIFVTCSIIMIVILVFFVYGEDDFEFIKRDSEK